MKFKLSKFYFYWENDVEKITSLFYRGINTMQIVNFTIYVVLWLGNMIL